MNPAKWPARAVNHAAIKAIDRRTAQPAGLALFASRSVQKKEIGGPKKPVKTA
jgi:hypothetical protein